MNTFKIRASAISQIMTNPRSKSETISKTTATFLQQWYKEQLYDRRKEFTSKYTEKGLLMESESISYLESTNADFGFLLKNEQWFENDFMHGTPDVVLSDRIIEMKNSWDCFTFPLFDTEPDKGYEWQVQAYMELTGRKQATIAYMLMNTPDVIIDKAIRSKMYELGTDEIDVELEQSIMDSMRYDNISPKLRIKLFNVQYDPDAIEQIRVRVEECRAYLETIKR